MDLRKYRSGLRCVALLGFVCAVLPATPRGLTECTAQEESGAALLAAERAAVLGLDALLPDAIHDARVLRPPEDVRGSDRHFFSSAVRNGRPGVWSWREGSDLYLAVDENFSEEDPATALGRPDSLEDVWLVDHDEDGTLDRVADWEDVDRDGRADRQLLFTFPPGGLSPDRLAGVIVEQRDADRGFWHLERLQYSQFQCQWRTDWNGSGFFVAAQYDDATRTWEGFDEYPFCFFDHDGNGMTDEVLRVSGDRGFIKNVRWSWDADGDAGVRGASNPSGSPYDYDVSITTRGQVRPAATYLGSIPIRNGESVQVVHPDSVRSFAARTKWKKALLTWDENDRNVAFDPSMPEERWEGVIASDVPDFPQVGGPGSGPFEKRFELDLDGSGGLGLYVSAIDGKIHLLGAERGWIEWDDDGDWDRDARLHFADTDGDGYFDRWAWDRNADGVDDLVKEFSDPKATVLTTSPDDRVEAIRAAERARLAGRAPAAVFEAERKAWQAGRPPLGH